MQEDRILFIAPWQFCGRLMVLETADHDSSNNRVGRKSLSRLDREKDESSDWGMRIYFYHDVFFPPVPTPIVTRLIASFYFLPLLMSLSLAVTPSVICSWFLSDASLFRCCI